MNLSLLDDSRLHAAVLGLKASVLVGCLAVLADCFGSLLASEIDCTGVVLGLKVLPYSVRVGWLPCW
jgi:hypothetical protein